MTCHVDEKTVNEVYQNCVLDYRKQFDCSVAMQLVKEAVSYTHLTLPTSDLV